MADPFKELEQTTMTMLREFPIAQMTPKIRESALKVVEDGHSWPFENYDSKSKTPRHSLNQKQDNKTGQPNRWPFL